MTERARAWGPTAPSGPWDVIVIGAGVGGLSAAGLLAKLGRRVLVLEQHTIPGGLSQSFRRAQWSWDVGIHLVGEMGPASLAGRAFDVLTGGRLEWTQVQGAYDQAHLPGGPVIPYSAPLAKYRADLHAAFPREAAGIDRYFKLLHDGAAAARSSFVARGLMSLNGRPQSNVSRDLALALTTDVLGSVTRDPYLRCTLAMHWVFYGTPPSHSPFGIHALLDRHYRQGAYYPLGGAMSIARSLSSELASNGGWVRVSADVEQVLVTHGRATGVRLVSGEELRANAIVSAAGVLNTLRLLPDEERAHEWAQGLETLPPSSAHCTLHLGFRGDIRAAGATQTNRWFLNDLEEKLWDTRSRPHGVYVAFPSLKDIDAAPTAEVVAFCDWQPFARFAGTRWRQRGEEYNQLKAEIAARLRATLLEQMPGLGPLIAYEELSTPVTTAHFVRGVNGSAYGLDATPERLESRGLKARTPVRGLHLAGSDTAMMGVVGALIGGLAAAVSLEPERGGAWLRTALRRKSQNQRRSQCSA